MKKVLAIGSMMFVLAASTTTLASDKCAVYNAENPEAAPQEFCISPEEAYEMIEDNDNAIILDVRTPEEITYLGTPGPNRAGDGSILFERVGAANYTGLSFMPDVIELVEDIKKPTIITICRSGSRSYKAALDLMAAGYTRVYSVSDGFEGDRNPETGTGYRDYNGWIVTGLPYKK